MRVIERGLRVITDNNRCRDEIFNQIDVYWGCWWGFLMMSDMESKKKGRKKNKNVKINGENGHNGIKHLVLNTRTDIISNIVGMI